MAGKIYRQRSMTRCLQLRLFLINIALVKLVTRDITNQIVCICGKSVKRMFMIFLEELHFPKKSDTQSNVLYKVAIDYLTVS